MPRTLVISLDGQEIPVHMVKVDREKLYGTTEIEAFDEHGHEAVLRMLAADGKTIIDKGGTALLTLTEDGESLDRKELVPVDEEGDEIEPVPSSFNEANVLKKTTVDNYLSQIVKSVYVLKPVEESDEDFLIGHLSSENIYNFPFSYRGGVEYDNAFVLGKKNDAFMVVGSQAEFKFVRMNQATVLEPGEEQEISADELDFEAL